MVSGCLSFETGESLAGANQCGGASWYSLPGQRTASGERMNPNAMTAAHKTLPLGTVVKVVNQRTGRSIQVTINDRGPYIRGRIIDLSPAAARQLGIIPQGVGAVCLYHA
ncbi:MAG TPA: septal ring lytic transglycosylase RlpA family protein [Devosia sp.]|nr:septal ring lytic transglycosylase RlpA family protein [Devosia sp.]